MTSAAEVYTDLIGALARLERGHDDAEAQAFADADGSICEAIALSPPEAVEALRELRRRLVQFHDAWLCRRARIVGNSPEHLAAALAVLEAKVRT